MSHKGRQRRSWGSRLICSATGLFSESCLDAYKAVKTIGTVHVFSEEAPVVRAGTQERIYWHSCTGPSWTGNTLSD